MLSSGDVLDNRYRLDERIATGGMGDVWRGTDLVLGRVVAVKVLRPAMMADPEFAARFYGEARMLAAFRHPGVVEVYDYAGASDTSDGHGAYLVMAYVEGEPLSARLTKAGRLSVTETLSIVMQAADALHAAHQNGIVHRDVKPGNLVVRPNGAVTLVDFGVARSAAVTSVTSTNAIVGTALYMAPEQVSKGRVSPATDIYALGAVAYHCLAGHPPFEGENPLQVALRHLEDEPPPLPADVPQPVRALVARALAKRPTDRFPSAAAFADAALAAGSGELTLGGRTDTTLAVPAAASLGDGPPPVPLRVAPHPGSLRGLPPETAPLRGSPPDGHRGRRIALLAVAALLMLSAGAGLAALALNADDLPANPHAPASSAAVEPSRTSPTPTKRSSGPARTRPRPGGGEVPRTTPPPSPSASVSTEPSPSPPPESPAESPPAPEDPGQPSGDGPLPLTAPPGQED